MNFTSYLLPLTFVLALFAPSPYLTAQHSCGMDDLVGSYTYQPHETTKSALCDLEPTGSQITTKTISLTFHIFQKDDGTGNIQAANAWTAINYHLVTAANLNLANLGVMNPASSSLYVPDAKIQFSVEEIFFWKNSTMWAKGDNTNENGKDLYGFIITKPEVTNKYNTIHIFIPGDNNEPPGVKGIASNIGLFRGHENTAYNGGNFYWSLLSNVYNSENTGGSAPQAKNLMHEVFHNINLWHTWDEHRVLPGNYQLPDTPPSSGAWNNSNNIMNYNPHINAISVDQFTRVHRWIEHYASDIVISGYQAPEPDLTYDVSSTNSGIFSGTVDFGAMSGDIAVLNASDDDNFVWTLLSKGPPSSAGYTINNSNGTDLSFYGLGWVSMQVAWAERCEEYLDNVYVYNSSPPSGSYLARQQPGNPAKVEVIEMASIDKSLVGNSLNPQHQKIDPISQVVLTDVSGRFLRYDHLENNLSKPLTLDWHQLNSGIIFGVIISTSGQKTNFKVLKQ